MTPSNPLRRLDRPSGQLTLGIDLPLDNDFTSVRRRGVPDLTRHAELAALADRLGFAALWVRDVPVHDPVRFGDAGTVFETFTHLGHLAATTSGAVLGTAAVALPLRNPLLVAKAAATVDVLSGGRFVLGLASGDRPVEYPLFGVDFDRRDQIFRSAVDTLRAAWATPAPGAGIDAPELGVHPDLALDVLPKPVAGTVPLVVAGRARQSLDWIARHADGWFNYPRDATALAGQIAQWHASTDEVGTRKPYLMPMMLDLAEDRTTGPSPIFHGLRLGGEAFLEHLGRLDELGVSHLSLSLRSSTRPIDEVLHELAETVLPQFPRLPVGASAAS
ncbi:TIGR03571 family LLM class oxidoreductase [Saccharothrix sp. S26]|uniref:TIGR03571 family LLM class oxidoreductase n=1 Tax=Saccharothrix sp. S26 TaxID=2907215 RepID=UPI001F27E246|nr:TIGR03571 family LLM class oxidoreductase [Saccharothrix sp. S26]MCE6998199.1 TIGR03571 family LLM class oxidoreductase [Saccharothrix sp. S26]